MKRHIVFVINPRSGTDRIKAMHALIESTLDKNSFTYEIKTTEHPGHGTALAAEAAAGGAFAVVAVGGDGSVNDVAAGLGGTETALAIIPKGSGNGMARTLRIPLNASLALEVINQQHTVAIDVGFANGRPFISNGGVGFDAVIAEAFAHSARRGWWSYAKLITKQLWGYQPITYELGLEGSIRHQEAFLIVVANGRQFGYDFVIAPDASVTDGLLDVIVIRPFPKPLGALIALRALKGNILGSRYVSHYRATAVTLAAQGLRQFQTDGDARACSGQVDFRIEQATLKVLLPGS